MEMSVLITALIGLAAILLIVGYFRLHRDTNSRSPISIQTESNVPLATVAATTRVPEPFVTPAAESLLPPSTAPASLRRIDVSLLPERFVVFDLETTGLNSENDEILEIGAIRVNRDSETHSTFQVLVRPGACVPKIITKITGITQAMVDSTGRSLPDALSGFMEFVGDLPLVSFNAAFDMAFVWNAAKRHGTAIDNCYTCALRAARRAWPGLASYRLVDLAKLGNLPDDDTHRALGDCKRTMILFALAVETIGERIVWSTAPVDWHVQLQYLADRNANRAFVAETRAFEISDPAQAIDRYVAAMERMYQYESSVRGRCGDAYILDRLTLCLGRLARYDELVRCVDEFVLKFPDAHSSVMESILKRKLKADSKRARLVCSGAGFRR